ncbi:MAG: hypothetical protein ACRDJL_05280 [Actinomycetota bacterium]
MTRGAGNGPRFGARRSWRSRLLELLLWAAVAVGTALILIVLSERLLPSNF